MKSKSVPTTEEGYSSFSPARAAQAIGALSRAAQGVRDQLSEDVWMVLADIDRALGALAANPYDQGLQLTDAAERVLSGLLAVAGIVSENMVRDPGWYMLDSGRGLERALQVLFEDVGDGLLRRRLHLRQVEVGGGRRRRELVGPRAEQEVVRHVRRRFRGTVGVVPHFQPRVERLAGRLRPLVLRERFQGHGDPALRNEENEVRQ